MLAQLITSAGLSSASGLKLHYPLLILGLAARFTHMIVLPAPYNLLTNSWVLIALGVLSVAEFGADKVPVIDHGLHTLGFVLNPAVGAFIFMAASHGDIPPVYGALAGIFLAGGTHLVRSSVRPVSTVSTAGMGNPILSLLEDLSSIILSLTAIFIPALAAVLLLLMAGGGFLIVRKLVRLKGEKAARQMALESIV